MGNGNMARTGLLIPQPESASALIRVLVLAEEETISGPAKNIFEFHRLCQEDKSATPVQLSVAVFQRSGSQSGAASMTNPFSERASELGIPVYAIGEGFRFDPRIVSRLRTLVRRVSPDVVETHHVKSHFILRASGIWKQKAWLAFQHGYTSTAWRSPVYNSLDRWSLPGADRIVTMNRVFARQLTGRGISADRITVLHNAARPPLGAPMRLDAAVQGRRKSDLGIPPGDTVILCVGRLSREKAQIDLVPGLHRLRQRRSGSAIRLILAGDGPERQRISRAAQAMGLGERVVFAGHVKDMSAYYGAADVVAIPSLTEGSPNVLLEAMAIGVPVVATAVGGIPEIATHGETALLVPPRDPDAMAAALDLLLSSPSKALSLAQQAQRKIAADHSPEARAKSLVTIYQSLARSSRSPGVS